MAPTSPPRRDHRRSPRDRRADVSRNRRADDVAAESSRRRRGEVCRTLAKRFHVSRPHRSSGSPRSWRSEFSASGRSRPAAPRYSRREAGRQSRPRRAPRRRRDPAAASTPQPRGDGATAPLRRRYSLPRRRRDRSAALPSRRRLDQAASSERLPSRRRLDQAAASPQSLHGVLAITRRDRDRAQVRDGATKLSIFNFCTQNSCNYDEYCCGDIERLQKCDWTNCQKKKDVGGRCNNNEMCKSDKCLRLSHGYKERFNQCAPYNCASLAIFGQYGVPPYEECASCDPGYELTGDRTSLLGACVTTCTCSHGTPAAGPECHGQEMCKYCDHPCENYPGIPVCHVLTDEHLCVERLN